ncbi:MAG: UDP-N-acetylmuramate--L-alanine ligase [Bacteroidales bacterium]|nr:UDP-N-acetylmuramate--L-alanine ligase [Bacteroidales bacterium]
MNYYFLGIGGIGMSALARYFHMRGDTVSGYDRTESPLTRQLVEEGIGVHYSDDPSLIPSAIDMVVYTPAVPPDTAEFQHLQSLGVPMRKRSQVLGELTRGKECIAVAGTHGKTSVASILAHLLSFSDEGCSAFLGGVAKNFNSNVVVNNKSNRVVVEADEFDRSFLQLHPHCAVITATDPDHLDVYGTYDCMLEAFHQFASQVDSDGTLVLKQGVTLHPDSRHDEHHEGHEHSHEHDGLEGIAASRVIYTAHGVEADFYPWNVRHYNGDIFFDLRTPKGVMYDLQLQGTALYNVENAVAAAAVAVTLGLNEHQLRHGLKTYAGVQRRFDYRIKTPELVLIDDYAHHPREIAACIESVRYLYPGKRVIGIFQPHLYSRTRDFADQFAEALSSLDELIMLPIYPAREKPILGVTSSMILRKIKGYSKYLCTPDQVLDLVPALCPDVVITMGAGDIDRLVPRLVQTLTAE